MVVIKNILLMIFGIYVVDKIICYIYCSLKAKQNKSFDIKEKKSSRNCYLSRKERLIYCIKQLTYGWMMYSVSRLGRIPIQKYRIFVLRHIYHMKIDDNVVIYGDFRIRAPWNISIGKGTVIGDGVQLDGRNGLFIGENVNLSTGVFIFTEQHDLNDVYFESGSSGGPVVIGNRAWISSRTTILPNVTIGEATVLASGAIATKDLESFSVYAGIPAKKIGERNRNLKYIFDGSYIPFY